MSILQMMIFCITIALLAYLFCVAFVTLFCRGFVRSVRLHYFPTPINVELDSIHSNGDTGQAQAV